MPRLILAAALLIAFRYEADRAGSGMPVVLDRWTGQIWLCQIPQKTKEDPFAGLLPVIRPGRPIRTCLSGPVSSIMW